MLLYEFMCIKCIADISKLFSKINKKLNAKMFPAHNASKLLAH